MAAVPPPMSAQPSPMQTEPTGNIPPISWEGDKMFNIYIHDYCSKRGFRKTAKELMQEAEISADATPPINARQGLLFEWWSVFWVLFQAKSNGGGSEDGLVYITHQAQQRQQANQRNQMAAAPLAVGGQSSQPPMQQGPPPVGRLPNGMLPGNMPPGMARPPSAYLANGAIPNGVGMNQAMGGQPQPPQSGPPMPPGTTMNFGGMGNHPPQTNGMPGSGPGPGGPSQQPQQQGIPNQSMPFAMPPNQQRPPTMMNGISPQPRGPPNGGPFHGSPTMAHSPQHSVGTPGHSGQQQQSGPPQPGQPGHPQGGPGQQPPMAQLGPSPHMTPMNRAGGMMPPNGGPPGMGQINPGQPQSQQQQGPPTPGYQLQQPQNPAGRPPSRTNTPRGGMAMTHASPSLAARQTPGGGMGSGTQGPSGMGMPGGLGGNTGMMSTSNPDQMNQEIMQIPQNVFNNLKQELGCGDKDISNLTMHEKNRILTSWRQQRSGLPVQQRKDGPGPSGIMQSPGQPVQPQQRPGQPPQQRTKRNSTSPTEEHETLPRNESSPPDRKRLRRSPGEAPMPYSTPLLPGQQAPGQQQPPPGQQQISAQQAQQQINSMMMMRGMQMNGGMPVNVGGPGGGPMPPPQQQHQVLQQPPPPGGPPGGMPPSMMQMGPHGPGSMMSPQQQQMHQQTNQQAQQQAQQQLYHRMQNKPGGPEHAFNQGPPPGSGPQFNNSPLNRLANKPSMSGMMPPPSPAINGPPKEIKQEPNAGNKPPLSGNPPPNGQHQQQPSHNPDGSPRNQPPGGPSGSGTAPPTPVPGNQPNPQQPQQQQQQQQQQQPPPNHLNMMPTSILGMPPSGGGMGPTDMSIFDPSTFMDTMGADGFDAAALFRPDGDINFERDFGQWFNPDDAVLNASLDMK